MAWDGKKVMLVDGSATLRYYFGILLKRLSFAVVTAEDAEDALPLMDGGFPSLILSDITLPGMSGIEFIKTLRKYDKTAKIPVIILADREDISQRSVCLDAGCSAFLTKNADPGLLYRTIQAALEPTPREYIRLSIPLKVVVGDGTANGGAERTEFATTISEGGLYLRTLYPQPKNSQPPVRIFIKGRTIKAKTSVVYSRTLQSGLFQEPGMGMQFLDISADDRTFVRRFIREQLTSDIVVGA